jgi:hypothetical protein
MASHTHSTIHACNKKAIRIFFFLIAAIFVAALVAYAQQDVGFVVNLNGNWILNSSRSLNAGSPLQAGDTIRARDPKAGDFIEIADLRGRIIKKLNCAEEDCKLPIVLKVAESSVVTRWFRAVMGILNRSPKEHQVAISRGEGDLREAVVKIAGEQVELSSVMSNLRRDTYLLRFDSKKAGATPVGPIRVDWNPATLTSMTVKGLAPGLYVVRLLNNQDREPREPGTEAWVLFTKPEKFDQAFCEFREAVVLTEEWDKSTRENSKRQLLRATLTNLEMETR